MFCACLAIGRNIAGRRGIGVFRLHPVFGFAGDRTPLNMTKFTCRTYMPHNRIARLIPAVGADWIAVGRWGGRGYVDLRRILLKALDLAGGEKEFGPHRSEERRVG